MRRTSAASASFAVVALALSACATAPPAPGPRYAPPPSPKPSSPRAPDAPPAARKPIARGEPLSSLPGWGQEDHAAAFAAFQAGCGAAREEAMQRLCGLARASGPLADEPAKLFLESHLVAEASDEVGSLTAYFAPEYTARAYPDAEYSAPVRSKPLGVSPFEPPRGPQPYASLADDPIGAVLAASAKDEPVRSAYPPLSLDLANADRRAIETSPPNGALAWMKPEELFFLQIQGSGVLTFPDGRRLRAAYAGDNGKPFVAIARPMVAEGKLLPNQASGDTIRNWLADHRGWQAREVMWKNPRYVFFSLSTDDGSEPAGAAGTPLPAGRAIAVDPSRHAYGEVFWIDAEAPILAGAFKSYRRLTVALDTGSAIRGEVRADLYMGRGDAAGAEAGRVRHSLKMMRLVPKETIRSAEAEAHETALAAR